jgi:hypothetical protein
MNLDPEIVTHAALLQKPTCYKELSELVVLLEERMAILAERKKLQKVSESGQASNTNRDGISRPKHENTQERKDVMQKQRQIQQGTVRCYRCGKLGHLQKYCRKSQASTVAVIASRKRRKRKTRVIENSKLLVKVK